MINFYVKEPALLEYRLQLQREHLRYIFAGNRYETFDQGKCMIDLLLEHVEQLQKLLDECDQQLAQQFAFDEPEKQDPQAAPQ
jgi:hypothetical protein